MVYKNKGVVSMAQKKLTPSLTKLVLRYKRKLEKNILVTDVIVFGSQAKGTAGPYSDIDVCVVSPQLGKDRHNERVMLSRLSDGIDLRIEPHPYHPDDFKDIWDSLAHEILSHGIAVK